MYTLKEKKSAEGELRIRWQDGELKNRHVIPT